MRENTDEKTPNMDTFYAVLLLWIAELPAGFYLLKVNNRNTRARCEVCSTLTIKTPERRRSGAFIVNIEHFTPCSSASIFTFKHVIASYFEPVCEPGKYLKIMLK